MAHAFASTADGNRPQGEGDSFLYRIDAEDRLTFVASAWLDFAEQNEAPELSTEAVQGESLFRFIADPETRHLYKVIIDRVRRSQTSVLIPFRCDSPALRRFMMLHISPLPDDGVQFEGRLVREEAREPVALLDPASARSDGILIACSWCKRIDVDGAWLEVEDAVRRLGLFDHARLPRISHGICPACLENFGHDLGL